MLKCNPVTSTEIHLEACHQNHHDFKTRGKDKVFKGNLPELSNLFRDSLERLLYGFRDIIISQSSKDFMHTIFYEQL